MNHYLTSLFCICILALPLSSKGEETEKPKPAIAWEEVDATEFAAKVDKAVATGEKWTANPESIILEYVGPFIQDSGEKAGQSRTIRINAKGEDLPKVLMVVLIDDGLFDDSTKTIRNRLGLTRTADGKWKVRKAFRSLEKWPKPGA